LKISHDELTQKMTVMNDQRNGLDQLLKQLSSQAEDDKVTIEHLNNVV
jgi:chromosome segregation ATPase